MNLAKLKEKKKLKSMLKTLSKKSERVQKESAELKKVVSEISKNLAKITEALGNPIRRQNKKQELKTTEGQIGNKKVETKQVDKV